MVWAEMENLRELRGREIAETDSQIKRLDAHSYRVNSQSGNGVYGVLSTELGWMCECPDHIYRDVKCKHIWAVEFSLTLRNEVESQVIIQPLDVRACRFCGSSNIVKDGLRHNKHGDLQVFNCKDCGHYFTVNLGFEKMRATPQIITSAMQLYFTGESLRNVQKFFEASRCECVPCCGV